MDADSANSTRVIVDDDDLLAPARYFKSQNLFLIHLIFFSLILNCATLKNELKLISKWETFRVHENISKSGHIIMRLYFMRDNDS